MNTQEQENATLIANTLYVRTPLGMACIQGNQTAITSIKLVDAIPDTYETDPSPLNKELLLRAAAELNRYFEGSLQEFTFPMQPQGTTFQQSVWERLQKIPFGKSMSYLELSKDLGDPKAIRAVAAANGKNPIWIAIPCHRIIGSDGSLVGYAGGLHRKKWLLNHESPHRQVALFD
ncbi:methylated-DNA-[protein]-cysteine S-methyltransferase [Robiginitalea myxolifaciens]|uniref:Methylated-DNA--protein-cysteine methyltransferase n=1 Tax=Robiginitalea myxolifaciens TaxID=400055 RepID=A0A1I6G0M5_9FLAO|nr:methylated-DNA--[protein]-cysteine S-methyltransferase [Robiginitalea myxolifaciens]SFR35607.1 methylated-DNA-[protein]-cysteine S-methyltransferase [Robiginitalea myxolifaciens]